MAGFLACKTWQTLATVLLLVLVAACSTANPQNAPAPHEFLLSPGDKIHLTVYEEERMTGDYTVDENGEVIVPMIGGVHAEGLSKNDLQRAIAKGLRKSGLYKSPHVTVDVASLRPLYVLGEVGKPGAYPFEPSLDVFSAVALAGGYTPRASKGNIVITRDLNGKKIRFDADEDTPVFPGDSITVRQRFF